VRILGIDPGSLLCGYGVVEQQGQQFTVVEYGVIEVGKSRRSLPLRLRDIFRRMEAVVERSLPDETAIESLFYGKNAASLVKLAQARSAALLPSILRDIPIVEYSPREVKKAVTGRGNAAKSQVQYMVQKLLAIRETPEFYDVTDALAVALCHGLKKHTPQHHSKSWKEFVQEHPERIYRK